MEEEEGQTDGSTCGGEGKESRLIKRPPRLGHVPIIIHSSRL